MARFHRRLGSHVHHSSPAVLAACWCSLYPSASILLQASKRDTTAMSHFVFHFYLRSLGLALIGWPGRALSSASLKDAISGCFLGVGLEKLPIQGIGASLLFDSDLVENLLKAGIAAQRIRNGIDTEEHEAVVALCISPIEPIEGRNLLPQAEVNRRKVERGDVV